MVGVLVGDKNVLNRLRGDSQPAHFFRQPVIVVPGIDHNDSIVLAVEEDICYPFPHAGNVFIDPAGVQRL